MNPIRNIANVAAMRTAGRVVVARSSPLSTSARLGLKESSSQTDVDYEKHKADSLAKQKKGTGHWKPELASDSEEAIKADKGPAGPNDTAKLQEQTKGSAEAKHKSGTSQSDA